MSIQALRKALLEAKSHLRGKRASDYMKKVEDGHSAKSSDKDDEKESRDRDSDDMAGDKKDSKAHEKAEEKKESPIDFAEEMKNFMSKKNRGSTKGPTRVLTGAIESPKAKKKVTKA